MQITNEQRNLLITNLLAEDFSNPQLKFIIYLMNLTFNCQTVSLYIPSIFKLANIFGYEQVYFSKEIKKLINNDVILRHKKNYAINLDAKVWQTNKKRFSDINIYHGKQMHEQLNKLPKKSI